MNESEIATFTCTAAGSGDLIIEWICSNSGVSSREEGSGGYVTSILEIPGATNLSVTCVMNQSLTSISFEESNGAVEARLPPPTESLRRTAQLTVIPTPVTTTGTTPPETTQGLSIANSGGEKE